MRIILDVCLVRVYNVKWRLNFLLKPKQKNFKKLMNSLYVDDSKQGEIKRIRKSEKIEKMHKRDELRKPALGKSTVNF